jgi:Fe2+ or Zn2+ uptake regulation protein
MKNYSRQREEILKVVKELHNHPTAEDIYMIVKAKDPSVSRSTVYRNLGLLVENKIINKISMLVGPDRYDYIKEIHNHAICVKCGNIFDFNYDFKYEEIKKSIKEQTGIELLDKGIALEGICDSCKNKI